MMVADGRSRGGAEVAKGRRDANHASSSRHRRLSGGVSVRRRARAVDATAPAPSTPLQRLLAACRRAFGGPGTVPAPDDVALIRGILGRIGPHDVGLMDDLGYFHRTNAAARQNPPTITCKTIYSCSNFTVAVFFLPRRAVMPLHDHPGMTVFSKVLMGSAHVEAYDWVRPRVVSGAQGSAAPAPAMLAEKVLDHDVAAASDAWVLYPDTGGNMHRFVADDGHCAFLDVLAPPYAPAEQRPCTYYEDLPYEEHDACAVSSGLTWLREVPQPKDLRIANLPYQGPKIF